MADPTIQTFCCHHGSSSSDMAVRAMDEFNKDSYNILCLSSSIIGILGALYQILPREETIFNSRRTQIVSSTRGRNIIKWLAIADLLASLGVFVRSIVWMKFSTIMDVDDDTSNVLFCALTSAWTQYFYTATWLWTLCYAIDTYLLLHERDSNPNLYHTLSWGLPALLTTTGLSILYIPNANCHNLSSIKVALTRILPNYCATYIPIAVVMIANPILYTCTSRNMENAVLRPLSQITSKERFLVDALKWKFGLINMVFYLCWLPNLINGILLWTLWFNLPVKIIVGLWYIMALMNPLQALLNAMVYRRWTPGAQKIILPFALSWNFWQYDSQDVSLRTPLLRPERPSRLHLTDHRRNSINGSSSI